MEKETLFCSLSLLSYFDYDKTDVSVEVMLKDIVNDQQLRLDYAAMPEFEGNIKMLEELDGSDYRDTVSYTHLDVYKRQVPAM